MGWKRIHLEGDAHGIVQAFNRETYWWGRCGVVIQDVKQLLGNVLEWRMEHVPCHINGEAYNLAKLSLSLQVEQT